MMLSIGLLGADDKTKDFHQCTMRTSTASVSLTLPLSKVPYFVANEPMIPSFWHFAVRK